MRIFAVTTHTRVLFFFCGNFPYKTAVIRFLIVFTALTGEEQHLQRFGLLEALLVSALSLFLFRGVLRLAEAGVGIAIVPSGFAYQEPVCITGNYVITRTPVI